jgi:hypothetical protein
VGHVARIWATINARILVEKRKGKRPSCRWTVAIEPSLKKWNVIHLGPDGCAGLLWTSEVVPSDCKWYFTSLFIALETMDGFL